MNTLPSTAHLGPFECGLCCPACDRETVARAKARAESERLEAERRRTLPEAKKIAYLLSLHPGIFRAAGLPIGGRR